MKFIKIIDHSDLYFFKASEFSSVSYKNDFYDSVNNIQRKTLILNFSGEKIYGYINDFSIIDLEKFLSSNEDSTFIINLIPGAF